MSHIKSYDAKFFYDFMSSEPESLDIQANTTTAASKDKFWLTKIFKFQMASINDSNFST